MCACSSQDSNSSGVLPRMYLLYYFTYTIFFLRKLRGKRCWAFKRESKQARSYKLGNSKNSTQQRYLIMETN